MTPSWLIAVVVGTTSLLVSACVLVENFQGYQPIPTEGACTASICPDGGVGAGGGGAGGVAGAGGAGGIGVGGFGGGIAGAGGGMGGPCDGGACPDAGPTRCAKIPCTGAGSLCDPFTIASGIGAAMHGTDPSAIVLATGGPASHIQRFAKPGCSIATLDQPASYAAEIVSNGTFMAWIKQDVANQCGSVALEYCNPEDCKPLNIPVFTTWPEQGRLAALALGSDYLYFMFSNGLVGRASLISPQPDAIWVDPAYMPASMAAPREYDLDYHNGRLSFSREVLLSGVSAPCTGGTISYQGAVVSVDATPGAVGTVLASGLGSPNSVAASDNYLFFHQSDAPSPVFRVPKAGGAYDSLAVPDSGIQETLKIAPKLVVHKSWIYFEANQSNGNMAILRLPTDTPTWTAATAEIVASAVSIVSFAVDDDGVFWTECEDIATCATVRIVARAYPP